MNFEEVVSRFLFNQPHQTLHYYASIYNSCEIVEMNALLYAMCINQRDYNSEAYNEVERERIGQFINNLLTEEALKNRNLTLECIEFFKRRN